MTTLATIEEQVLEELGENVSAPAVWPGTTDLREALADAIDEVSMVSPYFESHIVIPMEANVMFYEVGLESGYPLYIRDARIMEGDARLQPGTLGQFIAEDHQFMLSRGTPRAYASLSPSIVMIVPCNSTATDIVKLSVVYAPEHYGVHNEYLDIREEFEKGLVHYGKYHKLLQTKGSFRIAMEEYEEYLRTFGLVNEMQDHAKVLARLRLSDEGGPRRYGEDIR